MSERDYSKPVSEEQENLLNEMAVDIINGNKKLARKTLAEFVSRRSVTTTPETFGPLKPDPSHAPYCGKARGRDHCTCPKGNVTLGEAGTKLDANEVLNRVRATTWDDEHDRETFAMSRPAALELLSRLSPTERQGTWTKERPTKPGWYWWRHKGVVKPMEIRVYMGGLHVCTHPYPMPLCHDSFDETEWSGPIPEPGPLSPAPPPVPDKAKASLEWVLSEGIGEAANACAEVVRDRLARCPDEPMPSLRDELESAIRGVIR